MDLLAKAVPFFLLAVLLELGVDRARKSGFFRSNDAINSLSVGMLNVTFGYATKFVSLVIWGAVLRNFAMLDMPLAWFDTSLRGIILWLAAAIAWDFCYYWFHRFSHEISVLWAAHAVHHQSEDYNLSTALRQTSSGFLFGWVFYLPLFLIGFPLEILLTVNAINLIYQFWVHTRLVGRLGMLDYILVTPSNHRVHHAQNERYIDKNYGGMLIIWDRLFGTFEDERDDEAVVFGVRKPLANWNPFWANLQVYDYLLFDARKAQRLQDKLSIWFRRTGWRPADVAARYPKPASDLATFAKYDPPIKPSLQRYILAQFGVAVATLFVIASIYAHSGLQAALLPCVLLWAQLFTHGLLSEGRARARAFELLRLVIVVPLAVAGLLLQSASSLPTTTVLAVTGVYIVVSLTWLGSIKEKQHAE
ncbi:MAG: sterol desaturase family protein [Gammaproteobacteria bacterium]|nr:sterol desaturase family protein [Gammaproteobacteria bacterium]